MTDESWSRHEAGHVLRDLVIPSDALHDILSAILARGARARFRAPGWSMFPAIRDGDVLTLASATIRDVRIGDVVAVWRAEAQRLVVHRAVTVRRSAITCHGDNLPNPDEPAGPETILGIVVEVIRNGAPVPLVDGRWSVRRAQWRRHFMRMRGRGT